MQRLSQGLDEAMVRLITVRSGDLDACLTAIRACQRSEWSPLVKRSHRAHPDHACGQLAAPAGDPGAGRRSRSARGAARSRAPPTRSTRPCARRRPPGRGRHRRADRRRDGPRRLFVVRHRAAQRLRRRAAADASARSSARCSRSSTPKRRPARSRPAAARRATARLPGAARSSSSATSPRFKAALRRRRRPKCSCRPSHPARSG